MGWTRRPLGIIIAPANAKGIAVEGAHGTPVMAWGRIRWDDPGTFFAGRRSRLG